MKYYNLNMYSRTTRKTQCLISRVTFNQLVKFLISNQGLQDEPWERRLIIELVKVTEDDN